MEAFIHGIPKAELHIHIEGALEPELMFEIAAKNGRHLPFDTVADIRRAYKFKDLQSFLNIYFQGAQVLLDEDDFYRLTWTYLQKAAEQNVRHTEIFFDPQTHTARGIQFETVVRGIQRHTSRTERYTGRNGGKAIAVLDRSTFDHTMMIDRGQQKLRVEVAPKMPLMHKPSPGTEEGMRPLTFKLLAAELKLFGTHASESCSGFRRPQVRTILENAAESPFVYDRIAAQRNV